MAFMPIFFRDRWVTKQEIINAQRALLEIRHREIEEWKRACLAQTRAAVEVALAARIAIESPEIDLRDEFDDLLRELRDQAARLEEQVL